MMEENRSDKLELIWLVSYSALDYIQNQTRVLTNLSFHFPKYLVMTLLVLLRILQNGFIGTFRTCKAELPLAIMP
jgi:hypothetical protein